jgi:hypothetical protein
MDALARVTMNKMRFGPHTPLVEEVIDYANTGDLFVRPYGGDSSRVLVETNFARARERAWTQDPESDFAIWTDLREMVMSKVRGQRHEIAGFDAASKELRKLVDELSAIFKKRLKRGPYDEILDDVASDFYNCAYKRAVLGNVPHLFETLYECYRAGGWPCGWRGQYPDGVLVVYSPS